MNCMLFFLIMLCNVNVHVFEKLYFLFVQLMYCLCWACVYFKSAIQFLQINNDGCNCRMINMNLGKYNISKNYKKVRLYKFLFIFFPPYCVSMDVFILVIVINCIFQHLFFRKDHKQKLRVVCREVLAFKYVFIIFFQNKSKEYIYFT